MAKINHRIIISCVALLSLVFYVTNQYWINVTGIMTQFSWKSEYLLGGRINTEVDQEWPAVKDNMDMINNIIQFQQAVPKITTQPIDLDVFVPNVTYLYDRLVLVTGFSENHYNESMGFIATAQKYMSGKKILVYNLGLPEHMQEKVKQLCDVELRDFPFNKYPPHVNVLLTYSFKVILINLALHEFGAIYYGDASIRFKKSIKDILPGIERHHGYMVNILGFDPKHDPSHIYNFTVPQVFTKLGVDREKYFNSNYSAPDIQPGTQLFINSTTIQTKLMQPWLECALDRECIAPKGSNRGNHGQDASAISLLVYRNLYREWTLEDNDILKMKSAINIRRDEDGFQYNPQYCNVDSNLRS